MGCDAGEVGFDPGGPRFARAVEFSTNDVSECAQRTSLPEDGKLFVEALLLKLQCRHSSGAAFCDPTGSLPPLLGIALGKKLILVLDAPVVDWPPASITYPAGHQIRARVR